jgi:Cd2+/Zn2+-exporting ATPase
MDCPTEENDIRRALASIEGIHSLRFQLSARTVSIDATTEALDAALAAIRKAGFDPKPVSAGQVAKEKRRCQ